MPEGNIVQMVTTDLSFHDGSLVPAGRVVNVDTDRVQLEGPSEQNRQGNHPNLAPIGDAVINRAAPVAAIAPSGPNPTMPQQVPPGAFQTTEGYVVPGGTVLVAEGSVAAANALDQGPEEEQPVRRQPAEATGDATTSAITPQPAADAVLQPGLADAERDELNALRAQAAAPLTDDERAELETLRASQAASAGTSAAAPTPPTSATPGAFNPETVIEGTVDDVAGRLDGLTREQLLAVKDAEADREQPRVGVGKAIDAAIAKLDAPAENEG